MRKLNKKGFTIIELLVVIVIIGILVALALPQLFAAQARGRDTERKNDLKIISQQLEIYFNDEGQYPESTATTAPGDTITTTYFSAFDPAVQGLSDEKVLQDPKSGWSYSYWSDGSEFVLTADQESTDDDYTVNSVNQNTED